MNGIGLYSWPNGRKYRGEFKNNLKHGHGEYTQADGKKYIGAWVNDK